MINFFKIGNLTYTPFNENFIKNDFLYLKENGLDVTENKRNADIFIASDFNNLKRFIISNPFLSNYLLWTNEPRFSTVENETFRIPPYFKKINVANVYNGKVFINNVTYQKSRFTDKKKLNLLKTSFNFKNKKVVALMSYYNGGKNSKLIIGGTNVDLIKKRSDLALYGFHHDLIDIFGKGWPCGVSKEDSRIGNWVKRKKEILQSYHFNLAFENTIAPFYVTEKIWDSIENYCLPIYYGGSTSTIYQIFPEKSFIDYSEFENPKDLYSFIQSMTNVEYKSRINKCINVYNDFIEKPDSFWVYSKKKMLNNILEICKAITHTNELS